MLKTATVLLFLAAMTGSFAQDYCALCADHTMCIYQPIGPMCNPLLASGTLPSDAATIVDVHNELRARVANGQESLGSNGAQPAAANMRKMVWDDELATVAQRWANQCNFGHDKCRNVGRFQVGQNAFMAGSSASGSPADWRSAVEAWYSEVKEFDQNYVSQFQFSMATGHYTQVAWADSYLVGCGFAQYPKDGWYWSYYICNYGPPGNFIGSTMYHAGDACSQCPSGTTWCDNGLCA